MKSPIWSSLAIGAAFCATLGSEQLFSQQQAPPPPPGATLAANQLDDLVAPIALYPDPLLSQILVASTYPLEIVEALQWMQRNPSLQGAALNQAALQQQWDPSIQALVVFPGVVKELNQDITWTTNLGNAFLNQQGDVMDAVQRMRASAQQAGKLRSTSQQTVSVNNGPGQPTIVIEPANPQVIYIPEYDPYSIWGTALYYPYAGWGYPRYGAGIYFGFSPVIPIGLWFGGGWGGWGGWGWSPGWGGRNIIVNNNFIHRYNYNASGTGSLSGSSSWSHNAAHRGGVPYSSAALSTRYGGAARQNLQARATTEQRQTQTARPQQQSAQRSAAQQPAARQQGSARQNTERMGNRQVPANNANANRSAFGGVREGSAVRTQSDHGFSSMGSRGGGGGGAPHGGGGGGGGGHAGGGRR